MSSLLASYDRITGIYPLESGFADYADDSIVAPLLIAAGTTAIIPNNAANIVTNNMTDVLYDGSRIRPAALNDAYILRVSLTCTSTAAPAEITVIVNLSPNPGILTPLVSLPLAIVGGAFKTKNYTFNLPFYATQTLMDNGGLIQGTVTQGGVSISNVKFTLFKIHPGQI